MGRWNVGLMALVVMVGAVSAKAEIIHKIFITSRSSAIDENEVYPPNSPNFGGLLAADYVVTEHAFYAGFPGMANWNFWDPILRAILSTPETNARDRLLISVPIYNMAGELVANDEAQLWSGGLDNPVQYDEFGQAVPTGTDIWTGTLSDGTWCQLSCGAWNSTVGSAVGGHPDILGPEWIQGDSIDCGNSARLYGVTPPYDTVTGEYLAWGTAPATGDFDDDDDVDGNDFLMWQRGGSPHPLSADDLTLWETQFGTTSLSTAAIPEPTTLLLAMLGLSAVGISRRRFRK